MLNGPSTPSPSFTAPTVTSDTKLSFDLTAKDDKDATSRKSDSVNVIVKPKAPPPPELLTILQKLMINQLWLIRINL